MYPTSSRFRIQLSGCAPFFCVFIKGPSKCIPRIPAPFVFFGIRGITLRYVLSGEVTIVGQNEVTPFVIRPFATLLIPCSTVSVSKEKSIP